MSRPPFTPSDAPRVRLCPASAALPQARTITVQSEAGTARHEFFRAVPLLGRDAALLRVPEDFRDECAAIELDGLPLDPSQYAYEVSFVYDPHADKAVETGRNNEKNREYGLVGKDCIPGTLDVVALVGDDGVRVIDYKSQHSRRRARGDWQLITYGLMAARAYARSWAEVTILRPQEHDSARWDTVVLDAFDLDAAVLEIRKLVHRIGEQRALYKAQRVAEMRFTSGDHCKLCPAFDACPVMATLAREMGTGLARLEETMTALFDPETLPELWARVQAAKAVIGKVEGRIYERAAAGPLSLGPGKWLGPRISPGKNQVKDADAVFKWLLERYGLEAAEAATSRKATIGGVKEALKPLANKGEQNALFEEALEALKAAGAVEKKPKRTIEVYEGDPVYLEQNDPLELPQAAGDDA